MRNRLSALLLFYCYLSNCQTCIVDNLFGNNGVASFNVKKTTYGQVHAEYIMPYKFGSTFVVGHSNTGNNNFFIAKLLNSGNLDKSFGSNGIFFLPQKSGEFFSSKVVLDKNGNIWIVGATWDSNTKVLIIRLNSDGNIDKSFGTEGRLFFGIGSKDIYGSSVVIDKDDRVIVSGIISDVGSNINHHIVLFRVDNNGLLDKEFGQGGVLQLSNDGTDEKANNILIDRENRIIILGQYGTNNVSIYIIRILSDGTFDKTFGDGGEVILPKEYGVSGKLINIDSKQRLIIGGNIGSEGYGTCSIVRVNPNGSIDNDFATRGSTVVSNANGQNNYSICVDKNDKILLAGKELGLVRINSDGSFDSTIGEKGYKIFSTGTCRALSFDGQYVYLAGESEKECKIIKILYK